MFDTKHIRQQFAEFYANHHQSPDDDHIEHLLPNLGEFQEAFANITADYYTDRLAAFYNEVVDRYPSALVYDDEVRPYVADLFQKFWPSDIIVFAELMPKIPDEYFDHYVLFGTKYINYTRTTIFNVFKSDDPFKTIKKIIDGREFSRNHRITL